MKRTLLLLLALTALPVLGQVKSTGTVSMGSSMTLKLDLDSSTSTVTYTITGPSTKWFAIGLNATTMSTNTPIDVVSFGTGLLDRYLNGGHNAPTTDTTNNLTLVSNNVSGTTRTIVVTRPFSTGDSKDFTFTGSMTSLNVIWAVGPSTTITSEHSTYGSKSLTFTLANDEFALEDNMLVYPVPAKSTLTLSNPKNLEISSVRIFDGNGRMVRELGKLATASETQIDVNSLSAGYYFLEITSGSQKTVKKFEKGL